jgi:hypothetical protein
LHFSLKTYRQIFKSIRRVLLVVAAMVSVEVLLLATLSAQITQTFTSSGTFKVPAGVTSITVECWGAGGAGGGSTENRDGGSGGGGGGYCTNTFTVSPGQSITVTVGVGGSGSYGDGADGSASSFLSLTANGGAGGGANEGAVGSGGTATGGSTNTNGSDGAVGGNSGGDGGDGANGGTGGVGNTDDNGGNGTIPGGGGGGGEDSGGRWGDREGGDGANGLVVVSFSVPAGYCIGYAANVYSESGVDSPGNSIGTYDDNYATLADAGDELILDLTGGDILKSGGSLDIRWRRNPFTGGDPSVLVEISADLSSWTTIYDNTVTSTTVYTESFTLPEDVRYVKFTENNIYDLDIDGLFYSAVCSTDPIFSINPSSIDFDYVASGSTDTQTFTLTGSNLDGTDVAITGSSDFQVSTDGSTFSNSVTISGYGTSISQDIYVQFAPTGSPNDYNDNVGVSGGGVTSAENVSVTGTSIINYCIPSVANNMRYIDRVRLGTIDNTPTGTGFTTGGYADYTGLSTDLDVGEQGVSITINVYSNTTYGIHVWIDWDQDGEFIQTGDNIICDYGLDNNGDNQETYTFNVPSDAALGTTRMRVRLIFNNNSCDNSCLDFDYGEVEDYTLNIVPPVSITTGSISPLSYCPGSSVSVPYSITGTFNSGNMFTAQLSDENGSFASPVDIGTLTSQTSGTISATIPSSGIVDGSGYRIRVVSSDPVFTGIDNGNDISIGSPELITSPGSQCKYGTDVTVTVSASSSQSGIFRWYSDAAGTNLLQESVSNETSSDYTVAISSSQTYYVELEAGGCSSPITPVNAYAIIPPTLNATAGGAFCEGSTVYLYSDGSGYDNLYWEAPNGFYSTDEDPVINNATTDTSGTYTVHTSTLSGVNLVTNGDFEEDNVGFTSEYNYEEDLVGVDDELVPEGAYSVTNLPSNVHNNFCNSCPDKTTGTGLQMVINGSTVSGDSIWMQKVNVVMNTEYQFSYYVQSVVNDDDDSPSELQFYVNGNEAGPIYTADSTTGLWTQFFYNWNSGSSTEAYLSLVNRNTQPGGNDFALDDIVFQHTCTAEASVDVTVGSGFVPDVTISADPGETICDGDLVTFTATPINGGLTPSYQWYRNGSPVTNEINSTFTPVTINDLDEIYCEMTTSLACISGSATVNSDTLTINVIEPPTAIAGDDLFSCGLSPVEITSGASATNDSIIEWTTSGTGVFSDATSLTACTYTPSAADVTAGSATITLTAYGNTPCGDAVATKTLTFTDPIDVKADYLYNNYCPQFLPPVSFNNDDDPRPPGRTELNFVLVPLNASADWQFELDFSITADPVLVVTLDIDSLAVIENGSEINATGGVYTAGASTDTIYINAFVVNQPGHSLDVIIDVINVVSAGCVENEEDNNTATITIYPMPAIGKFE